MNWMTKEQVQAAAKGTLLQALECSREHHRQGAECEYEEMVEARGVKYDVGGPSCALCVKFQKDRTAFKCGECPLGKCSLGVWQKVDRTLSDFRLDCSRANFTSFQKAEAKMVAKLDELIVAEKAKLAEAEKPKLRHGDRAIFLDSCDGDDERVILYDYDGKLKPHTLCGKVQNNHLSHYEGTGESIFDDLKALSEDVTEFEVDGNKFQLQGGNGIRIKGQGIEGYLYISAHDVPAVALGFCKLEATLNRKATK